MFMHRQSSPTSLFLMKTVLQYVVCFFFMCSVSAAAADLLGLYEGEPCANVKGWVCKKIEECKALGDMKTSRPHICGFDGGAAIICCPPPPSVQSTASSQCLSYTTMICHEINSMMREARSANVEEDEGDNYGYVVGGTKASPRTHYHMALIGYGNKSSIEWQCGGSIISHNFIMSAAHCAESPDRGLARWVRVGELDLGTDLDDARPNDLAIIERFVHPSYSPPRFYHDIALFKLERDLVFSPWVAPVCLATLPLLPEVKATAAGWGRTDITNDVSSHLLEVQLTLVDGKECKSLLGRTRKIPDGIDTKTMICAGEREGGKDACSGDSGGPLIVNSSTSCLNTQVGIISFGRLCALPNTPGVYTRVYHYISWIESIVWPS